MLTELGERLALVIDAKTDGAISNIRALSAEEKAAAERADILKAKIADLEARSAKGSLSAAQTNRLKNTKNELAGLEANLAKVPAGASVAERGLARLGLQGSVTGAALAGGLATAGVALTALGTFEFLKHGVDEYVNLATQIRNVQYASQGTAEDASKLVAVTNALGIDAETAALGVFRLGKNIELTPAKLQAYGIAIARDKQGNTDLIGTLANVADAYQKTQDPAAKAAIVYEAFGRAGTSMLPILNQNAAKLREIASEAGKQGRIFSQADLDRAKEYQITVKELEDSVQSLAIAAGRTLVPALSKVAGLLTDVTDFAAKAHLGTIAKMVGIEVLGPLAVPLHFLHLGGGSGSNARADAQAELQAQQDAAVHAALSNAAAATLGDGTALLATPGQGLADAKQTLADAVRSLADARALRNRAVADLAKVRQGAPGADALSLEAAVARVTAAQARLRAAEYVGGDARVSSARATLISSQKTLNDLRSKGGTDADKLAAATLRLHTAEERVADARRKEVAARKARAQASGFSATDIRDQLTAQLKDRTALSAAQAKLVGAGASSDLIAFLDKQNLAHPGTLVKVSKGINAALVAQLNSTLDQSGQQADLYSALAGSAIDWQKAGQDRGSAFSKGFQATAGLDIFNAVVGAGGRTGAGHTFHDSQPLPRYTFTGPIHVTGNDPGAIVTAIAAESRRRALSGASL